MFQAHIELSFDVRARQEGEERSEAGDAQCLRALPGGAMASSLRRQRKPLEVPALPNLGGVWLNDRHRGGQYRWPAGLGGGWQGVAGWHRERPPWCPNHGRGGSPLDPGCRDMFEASSWAAGATSLRWVARDAAGRIARCRRRRGAIFGLVGTPPARARTPPCALSLQGSCASDPAEAAWRVPLCRRAPFCARGGPGAPPRRGACSRALLDVELGPHSAGAGGPLCCARRGRRCLSPSRTSQYGRGLVAKRPFPE